MEALAYTHSYVAYEEAEKIEYDLPEFTLGWQYLPSSAWLSFLGVAVLFSTLSIAAPATARIYVKTNGSCLNARYGPGTTFGVYKCVTNGALLKRVVGESKDAQGNKWYKLSSGRWIMAKFTSGSPGNGSNPQPPGQGGNTLKVGSKGELVRQLQSHLLKNFFLQSSKEVDGVYGSRTAAAVKAYQAKFGLNADGVAGPATLKRMGLIN